MYKALKIAGISLGILFAIILGGLIAALLFFDPNDYRDQLAQAASEKLGHQVIFEGPLDANYFPWLGLTAHNVKIEASNDISNKNLASVGELSFKVKTTPLLRKEIQLDKILVTKAIIHLERNSKGQANWAPKGQPVGSENTTPDSEPNSNLDQSSNDSNATKALQIEISGIEISDSQVTYHDKKSNQLFDFRDLSLLTKEIRSNKPVDISGHFILQMDQQDNKLDNVTDFSGTLEYSFGLIRLNKVVLSTELKGKQLPVNPLHAKLQGNIEAKLLSSEITLNDLKAEIDRSKATGLATFTWKDHPHLDFNLEVDQIDANRYIASNDLSTTTDIASNHHGSPPKPSSSIRHIAYTPKKEFSYKGQVSLDQLKANKLTLTKIKLTASSHPQGLNLNPVQANLYGGSFAGQSLINQKNKATTINGQLKNIRIEDLLSALSGEAKLTGTGNANLDLMLNQSGLNGTTKLQFNNGYIDGVDLDYYLKTARLQLKGLDQFIGDPDLSDISEDDKVDNRKRTDYDTITATLLANSNVLTNNDLKLESNDLSAWGDGSIDLNRSYIEYKFTAQRKYTDGKPHPNALPIAVRVKGPFNDIKIQPDFDAYIKSMIKKKGEKKIIQQLDKALGGDGQNAESINDAVEKKIEKEINKGLKKLFKFGDD